MPRLPRRIYAPRAVGLGLGALCAGGGLAQAEAPAWVWCVMLTYCAAWPHVAYQLSRRSAEPADAERRNMLVDAFAGGFWVVGMAFNLLPSVLLLAALAMNNFSVGGRAFFARGAVAGLLGAGVGLLSVGWSFQPETSFATMLWCMPFLLTYPLVLGNVTYRLSSELARRQDELRLEKQRADEASLAQTRMLAELASRDELTGLYNRRHMSELLVQHSLGGQRGGQVFSVALVDLDRFKHINDTHGHATGDCVLRAFADLAIEVIRGADTVGRWGGEEFILLFPGSTIADATRAVDRLRERVAAAAVETPSGLHLGFTVSIGVTEHQPGERAEATIERADRAMYAAKQQGRNRVVPRWADPLPVD